MKKNDLCTITIHGYTAEGMGVGRTDDGMAVFVPGAAREDKLQVRLVKVLKNYAFGKIEEILEPSPYRVEADCPVFGKCGGCDFRHLTYEEELWLKARRVHDAMTRIGGFDLPVPDVTGSPDMDGYRNKAQFPVGLGENGMNYGFFRSRSHQLIPLEGCKLQSEDACALAEAVCRWADQCKVKPYDETAHAGLLRHIYVRQGRAGLHLTLVVLRDKLPREDLLVEICREAVPALCGIVVNVNPDRGNRVLGQSCRTLWGDERLEDDLMGNTFRLSPLSFYQVNHRQTENLYACAARWASPDGDTEALDLYCGVGTITLTLAGHCKSVVGVEIVPAAIEDAKENAARNGIENARFLCADAGQAAAKMAAEGFRPGVIVVDPPRKGLDEAAVKALCDMAPDRIVYVSCDCASLARDAKMLFEQGGYRPTKVQAFDMFPRTANIETVALLSRQINVHNMKLYSFPFEMIKSGNKTIELRLYDEKRQQVKVGDKIVFTNTATGETLNRTVVKLHRFDSFEELYESLPLLQCGYTVDDVDNAKPSDMEQYYSLEEQKKYGAVGIELCQPKEITDETVALLEKA